MKQKNYHLNDKCCAKCKYLNYYLTVISFHYICEHPIVTQEMPWDKEICLAGVCDWYKPSSKVPDQIFGVSLTRQVNFQEYNDKLQITEEENE